MARLREFLKRHVLWVGFAAAAVPLAILMVLQFTWLVKLEESSAIAYKAYLQKTAEGISRDLSWSYEKIAYKVLFQDPYLVKKAKYGKIAQAIRKQHPVGVREFFLLDMHDDPEGRLLFYDPGAKQLVEKPDAPEVRAIQVATAPFQMMAWKKTRLEGENLTLDEKHPDYPIILNPITDESRRIIAVMGMIPDEEYFWGDYVPRKVRQYLDKYWGKSADELIVVIQENDGPARYRTDNWVEFDESDAYNRFPWMFGRHYVLLKNRGMTPEQLARSNFAVNLTMSGLLAVVLLTGVALVLRTASREMKLSEMKTDFVSNVSHELRTPLASIRVFGEFLGLGRVRDPEKVREYGDYIESESRRLTQLINNILDFSKIESGGKTYRFEQADVGEVIDEVMRTFEVRLRHSEMRIEMRRPHELPDVRIDPDAIAQAFHNLLDNAVKYSGDATRVEVALDRVDGGVELSVRDHGIGISRKEQGKVFDRFHRVGTGAIHNVRGNGLGLSIVQHVVEAHGGRVSVDSEVGHGSRFSIWLPSAPDADQDRGGKDAPASARQAS